ncbi:MAG TPA: 50S ribosomal protein L10 [Candidatus Saccharimonadales bacterium]|nr:50S ribosomal protein L10 [Candidatus Saccharimonadales bacterium]
MAITRQKKEELVSELNDLLTNSKLTVLARYEGLNVAQMQALRRAARENGTKIKIVKNRLVKVATPQVAHLKDIDTSVFTGQLLYAFNDQDEVAPAQVLATFAKANPALEFVAGLTNDGKLLDQSEVVALASLPTKDQLRAQLVGTLSAPLTGFMGVLSGNIRGVLNVLSARSESLGA